MVKVKILDPKKLRLARGNRTLRQIADASNGHFSSQQIWNYETGKNLPVPESQPILLKALRVEFDDVASPVTPAAPARRGRRKAQEARA